MATTQKTFNITGMTCHHCTSAVNRALVAVPGVTSVSVSLEEAKAEVTFDPTVTGSTNLISAIEDEGYSVTGEKN